MKRKKLRMKMVDQTFRHKLMVKSCRSIEIRPLILLPYGVNFTLQADALLMILIVWFSSVGCYYADNPLTDLFYSAGCRHADYLLLPANTVQDCSSRV